MIIKEETNKDILVEFMRKYEYFDHAERKILLEIIKQIYLPPTKDLKGDRYTKLEEGDENEV